jgi:hypothetical protein
MNGYTDPETGYDADDLPEQGQMGLEELRASIQAGQYRDADNIYCVAGTYSVSSDVLIALDWVDTVGGFRARWGF